MEANFFILILSRKTFAPKLLKQTFVLDVWFVLDCVCCSIGHLSNIDEISIESRKFLNFYKNTKWLIKLINYRKLTLKLTFVITYFFLTQLIYWHSVNRIIIKVSNNLFMTSKKRNHQFINIPNHEFKLLQKAIESYKIPF